MQETKPRQTTWLIIWVWSVLLGTVGYFFWRIGSYGRRLWRQPLLMSLPLPALAEDDEVLEARAVLIASTNLRGGIEKRLLLDGREKFVLCAGRRNFREPWARDLSFASFGLIELDEWQAARESLEVFLINQKPTGQFPVKIHSTTIMDRYLHSLFSREQPIHAPLKPKYVTAHKTISLDGNALLVIAILNYTLRSGDHDFARRHWLPLKQALNWVEGHALEEDGLLHQSVFADWADSIGRAGRVLYTNVVYWKALHDLGQVAANYGPAEDQPYLLAKAERVKKSINDHFWREDLGYYVTSEVFDNLSSSGNLLAIAWDLTNSEQAHSILDKMNEFKMTTPVPTQVVSHPYPTKYIALENRLGGIAHYHTSAAWLWLGAWHIIALARMERLQEAEALRVRMAEVIVREGAVHEVYAPNGQYLSTFWYTSEAPLTWSAGLFIYANEVYQRHLAGQPIGQP